MVLVHVCLLPNVTSSASPGVLEGVQVETTVSEINIVFYDEYQRFGTHGEVDSIPRGVCRHEDGHIMPSSTFLLPLLTPNAHISRKYCPWSLQCCGRPNNLTRTADDSEVREVAKRPLPPRVARHRMRSRMLLCQTLARRLAWRRACCVWCTPKVAASWL